MKAENCQLLKGDCLEKMKGIPDKSIDLILCDLPYGTTNCQWDSVIDLKQLWSIYERIIKDNGAILLFAQSPFDKVLACSNLSLYRYEIIWVKNKSTGFLNANKMPLKKHENILVFYKSLPTYNPQMKENCSPVHNFTKKVEVANKTEIYNSTNKVISGGGSTNRYPTDVVSFSVEKNCYMPTQKPVKLLEYLIKTFSNEGEIVLDNCMGSGSTGIAAINMNRRFIGIEKDSKNYNIAENRLKNYSRQVEFSELLSLQ